MSENGNNEGKGALPLPQLTSENLLLLEGDQKRNQRHVFL